VVYRRCSSYCGGDFSPLMGRVERRAKPFNTEDTEEHGVNLRWGCAWTFGGTAALLCFVNS